MRFREEEAKPSDGADHNNRKGTRRNRMDDMRRKVSQRTGCWDDMGEQDELWGDKLTRQAR